SVKALSGVSREEVGMRKAIPFALLLIFATARAAGADDMSNRFKDAFGDDTAPVLQVPKAPATAAPAPDTSTPAAPAAIVIPKPKPRQPPAVAREAAPPKDGDAPPSGKAAAASAPPVDKT